MTDQDRTLEWNIGDARITRVVEVEGPIGFVVPTLSQRFERDEQVHEMKLQNAREACDNGLISQNEQAQMALGKEKADAASPRASATLMLSDPAIDAERGSTQTCLGA